MHAQFKSLIIGSLWSCFKVLQCNFSVGIFIFNLQFQFPGSNHLIQVFSKSIYCVQKLNNCDKIVNVQHYNAVKCHTLFRKSYANKLFTFPSSGGYILRR